MLACENAFTGIFLASNALRLRAGDPELRLWGASLAQTGGVPAPVSIGGAGESERAAHLAAIGEGIERHRAHPAGVDSRLRSSFALWPLSERAIPPEAWALFAPEQYAQQGFPFAPFTPQTECRWSCFRDAVTGERTWIPEDLGFLFPAPGESHSIAPGTSTGLVAGLVTHPVVLRGTQECIERDGVLGAWWGRYGLEEWPEGRVFDGLGSRLSQRLRRPNLRYRFFRVRSPFSDHVALVSLEGPGREQDVFSFGAACRETRLEAFRKAAIEAVQGRAFVRYLLDNAPPAASPSLPTSFAEHAVYYTMFPSRRAETVLHRPPLAEQLDEGSTESLPVLAARLGGGRPILFRITMAPNLAELMPGWTVVRVVVPGLTPVHGHHALPHLGGSLWGSAPIRDYAAVPPHPLP